MNREKLVLTKEDARLLIWGDLEGFTVIKREMTDHTRWSIHYDVVVQREKDGKFFSDSYSKGATEQQDERPYEYTEPNFTEVFPKQVTITIYE